MKLMDRNLILLAIAATALAQQPSPEAAAAEAGLRARAQQFFDLQVAKKYRAAEPMVAADSQDAYYNGDRYNIRGFSIQRVEMLRNNSQAKVTIKAKVNFVAPGVPPMEVEAPVASLWKVENGQWVWFVDQAAGAQTPFGTFKPSPDDGALPPSIVPGTVPDASTLQRSVTIDKVAITVSRDTSPQTATISNQLPGPVDLEISSDAITGVIVELEKKSLLPGENTVIRFRTTGKGKGSGTVHVMVSPIAAQLDIRVTAN
jgi:hypothetical protein